MTKTSEYRSWCALMQRIRYSKHYEAVAMSDRWWKFENFFADMGAKPFPTVTLDRKDPAKGYCKENCQWGSPRDQTVNRRHVKLYSDGQSTLTLSEWSVKSGVPDWTLRRRIAMGQSIVQAMSAPAKRLTKKGGPTVHGASARGQMTAEYKAWRKMKYRCRDSKAYRVKGVSVCERWMNSFVNFLSDMGRKPSPDASLDRIDPNGDYSKENCRWASSKEQARNKTNIPLYDAEGHRLCLKDWANLLGVSSSALSHKIRTIGFQSALDYFKGLTRRRRLT